MKETRNERYQFHSQNREVSKVMIGLLSGPCPPFVQPLWYTHEQEPIS